MHPKQLAKTHGIQIGRPMRKGDETVTVLGCGRRAFDNALILFCRAERGGKYFDFDASLNDFASK